MEVSGQLHAPAVLPPGTAGRLGPRITLDEVAKRKRPLPCRKSESIRAACSLVTILTHPCLKKIVKL